MHNFSSSLNNHCNPFKFQIVEGHPCFKDISELFDKFCRKQASERKEKILNNTAADKNEISTTLHSIYSLPEEGISATELNSVPDLQPNSQPNGDVAAKSQTKILMGAHPFLYSTDKQKSI